MQRIPDLSNSTRRSHAYNTQQSSQQRVQQLWSAEHSPDVASLLGQLEPTCAETVPSAINMQQKQHYISAPLIGITYTTTATCIYGWKLSRISTTVTKTQGAVTTLS